MNKTEDVLLKAGMEVEPALPVGSAIAEEYRQFHSRIDARLNRYDLPPEKKRFIYLGGRPPYGWISFEGRLIEFEPEQKVIRLIYHLRRNGLTLPQIAEHLAKKDLRPKQASAWSTTLLRAILKGVPDVVYRQTISTPLAAPQGAG